MSLTSPFVSLIDRIPPCNLEAEMALLGSVLVDKEMMAAVSDIVCPSDFYASLHETIYLALFALYESGKPLDKVALAEELRSRGMLEKIGGLPYLSSLMETVPTAASAEYYAKIVREKASLRGLIHAGARITQLGYESENDALSAFDNAQRVVGAVRSPASLNAVEWDDPRPWPVLDPTAYYGLAGEIAQALEPHTEADPAALLFSVLTVAGNMSGKNTRALVHADEHPPRLFTTIVGETSSGAKGTGLAAVRGIFRTADAAYLDNRVLGGFGSGEAIVAELQERESEPFDLRLLILETELAALLAVNNREGSKSSMMIRQAWDGNKLEARRSKDKSVALNHHVSCLAHITPEELLARLTENESANGFANRFMFVGSRRSKLLPFGGDISKQVSDAFAKRLRDVADWARVTRTLAFSESARPVWDRLYRGEPERGGLVGKLTARAHPQKLRLAVIFAILDESDAIEAAHVVAAEACWRYSVATVEHVFGMLRGDAVQDRLLDALRAAFPAGLTGAQQAELFRRNLASGRLLTARKSLEGGKLIQTETQPAGERGGRPSIISFAIPSAKRTNQHELTEAGLFRVDSSIHPVSRGIQPAESFRLTETREW